MSATAGFQTGELLGGKYRILDLLGQGGMGAVYLAENVDIGRQVAIKVLKPELAAMPDVIARFRQEARAAAAVGHPGIVDVLDMGTLPDGGAFIVMERLDGHTLRERLAGNPPLSVDEAVTAMVDVLETLGVAHDKGVIHRDLKPDNVFLVERPVRTVKILDFGISKFRSTGDMALTRTGMVMGTPLYMSPEQARGAKDVGPLTDVYSCGAILYEILGGRPPFPGETYNEVLAQVLTETPMPLGTNVPKALATVVESMLSKNIALRPPSAREAAAQVRQAKTGLLNPASQTYIRTVADTHTPRPAFQTGPGAQRASPAMQTGPQLAGPRETLDPDARPPTQPMSLGAPKLATPVAPKKKKGSALPLLGGVVALLLIAGGTFMTLGPNLAGKPIKPPFQQPEPPPVTRLPAPPPLPAPTPTPPVATTPVVTAPTPTPPAPAPAPAPPVAAMPNARPLPPAHAHAHPKGSPSVLKGYNQGPSVPPVAAAPPVAAPPRKGGSLDLNCVPWCEIYVDGKDTGQHSPVKGLMLPAGAHNLRLVNPPSGREQQLELIVKPGEHATQVVRF
ncbi:MAG: protein kinase [Deltaproteobacteria bacterium]|nr:protein kinase [Deltaproteobacteria bacterium]